jgi:hypothetical protein
LGLILIFLLASAHLDPTLHDGAVLYADTFGGNVAVDDAFAADIDSVAAFEIAGNFAHDHNFAGRDISLNDAIAPNGDTVVRQGDLALDTAIDIESFGAADLAFDDERAPDGGLFDRCGARRAKWTGPPVNYPGTEACDLPYSFRPARPGDADLAGEDLGLWVGGVPLATPNIARR